MAKQPADIRSLKDVLKDTLKAPKTVQMNVPQDDPEVQRQVQEFIDAAQQDEVEPEPDQPAAPQKPRINIDPDNQHLVDTPQDQVMTEALVNEKDITVSDIEKDLFLKALLNDTPYCLTISLFGGQLNVEIQSRSHYEQRRIFDIATKDRNEGIFQATDYAMMVTRVQEYCAALQIRRINGELFSDISLMPGGDLSEETKILRQFVTDKLENSKRWTALVNAMRVFETKCATLHTMAANEDFWKPRVQD